MTDGQQPAVARDWMYWLQRVVFVTAAVFLGGEAVVLAGLAWWLGSLSNAWSYLQGHRLVVVSTTQQGGKAGRNATVSLQFRNVGSVPIEIISTAPC